MEIGWKKDTCIIAFVVILSVRPKRVFKVPALFSALNGLDGQCPSLAWKKFAIKNECLPDVTRSIQRRTVSNTPLSIILFHKNCTYVSSHLFRTNRVPLACCCPVWRLPGPPRPSRPSSGPGLRPPRTRRSWWRRRKETWLKKGDDEERSIHEREGNLPARHF